MKKTIISKSFCGNIIKYLGKINLELDASKGDETSNKMANLPIEGT